MKNKTRLVSFFMDAVTLFHVPARPAHSGSFTITSSPIDVWVNCEVFKIKKDVNGNDALVFGYNGTTYVPLRTLAETCGLEVIYDSSCNMEVVNDPGKDTATAQTPAPSVSSLSSRWMAA